MSAAASHVKEQLETASVAGSYCDCSLRQLSSEVRSRLRRWKTKDLMSSPAFAEFYCYPPAQRVSYIEGAGGEIAEACFYREEKWAGAFQSISLTCRVAPRSEVLRRLARDRAADLIRVPFLSASPVSQRFDGPGEIIVQQMADDYVIELPGSTSEYLRSLGNSTRKHLPYYLRRLKKEWGDNLRLEETSGDQISKETYCGLLALNSLRMGHKRTRSLWTEGIAEQRWQLVKECGSLGCIFLGDQLTAGTLSFVHGDESYLVAIAHDPNHDRFNLGNICLWLTIERFIARGFRRFHLLWGNSPYKEQFGAVAQPLYEMTLFLNPRAAQVWRAARVLRLPRLWSMSQSVTRKIAWMFSMANASGRENP